MPRQGDLFRKIDVVERVKETVEPVAMLVGTEADPAELDAVVTKLNGPLTQRSGWRLRTSG